MKHTLALLTTLLLARWSGSHAAESLPTGGTKSLATSSMMVSPVQGGRTEQRQPHLCLLNNGRVVATWTRRYEPHRRGTCVYSAFSDDGGRNWSQPVLVTEGVGENVLRWTPDTLSDAAHDKYYTGPVPEMNVVWASQSRVERRGNR